VIFSGDDHLIGTLQKVKIHGYSHQTLLGELAISEKLQIQKD
jgi:tRNA-2-methylthio-N6-dimethylallyladenosine synthase